MRGHKENYLRQHFFLVVHKLLLLEKALINDTFRTVETVYVT